MANSKMYDEEIQATIFRIARVLHDKPKNVILKKIYEELPGVPLHRIRENAKILWQRL